jgi:ATP-dependent Lhr-like helicase
VRDAEELHDALLTLIALPARGRTSTEERNRLEGKLQESLPAWAAWFEHLVEGHRAVRARAGEETYWVATERIGAFLKVFPAAELEAPPLKVEAPPVSREDAVLALITGWISHSGPVTANQLGSVLSLSASDTEKALLQLESSGVVVRGKFSDPALGQTE